MSNKVFGVVAGLLILAILVLVAVSFLLGRLSLSPLSLALLALLIVIPATYYLRMLPMMMIGNTLQDVMREQIEAQRTPVPRGAPHLCMAALAAAYVVIMVLGFDGPNTLDSFWFGGPLLFALGLFLFGWLGLIYTSAWVQRHGIALAFSGIPVVICGLWLLLSFVHAQFVEMRFIVVPLAIMISGVNLICVPMQISFARSWGLID